MDSLITAAARALAAGDPFGALNRVALRDDPPALALRGIAMAQLGDLAKARALLRSAARAFGPKEAVARARCVLAEAEVAIASRDLAWPARALAAARAGLESHGDAANAAHARFLQVRHLALIGRLDEAERELSALDLAPLPPALRAAHGLLSAGIAMRRVHPGAARAALVRARIEAQRSGIDALAAEVVAAMRALEAPAAVLLTRDKAANATLDEVEAVFASGALVVDACRFAVRRGDVIVSLARRPVLFGLLRQLAESWPGDAARKDLIARVFRTRHPDETHRARLRVEIGRLRRVIARLAQVSATGEGFALVPRDGRRPAVLAPLVEGDHAQVQALLADGQSWSSSSLALALGASQRTVQRALDELAAAGRATSLGRGRSCRWMAPPLPGFTTTLLLPVCVPGG